MAELTVSGLDGLIQSVEVAVTIPHLRDEDLDVCLLSPAGTRVELFADVGGTGQNFGGTEWPFTRLSDAALTPIADGTAPFDDMAGYKPQGKLSDLRGEDPNGIWRLVVTDDTQGETGTITHFGVRIMHGDLMTEHATGIPGYEFTGLPAGRAYYLRQEDRPGWLRSMPVGGTHTVTLAHAEAAWLYFGNYEPAVISGHVWEDVDLDGAVDPGEAPIAGLPVFLDLDDDHVTTIQVRDWLYDGGDVPIPNPGSATAKVELNGLSGRVLDVDVQLTLEHTRCQDLDVYLISPMGTRVELFTDVGGDSENFSALYLDDTAAMPITAGSAPFTGSHRPEGVLADFAGESAYGTWVLEVTDDEGNSDTGVIRDFTLRITTGDPIVVTDADGDYLFSKVLPGTIPIRVDAATGLLRSSPSDGTRTVTVAPDDLIAEQDFAMVQSGQLTGMKWYDVDGDTLPGEGEPRLADWIVYTDIEDNGTWDVYGPATTYGGGTSLPGYSVTGSSLVVEGLEGRVLDVNVQLDLEHPYAPYLDIYLLSPAGSRVRLVGDLPDYGWTEFVNTTFDDEASEPIEYGLPPYTRSYRPLEPLSTFIHEDPNGVWALEIVNNSPENGSLDWWSVEITHGDPAALTDASGQFYIPQLPPGDYRVREQNAVYWQQTAPAGGFHDAHLQSAGLVDGLNFGNIAVSPIPGDLNLDGYVGSADLDIVRGNWGRQVAAGNLLEGDASGDGYVGSADLDIVRAHWGTSVAAAASANLVAPDKSEPGRPRRVYGPQEETDAALRNWDRARLAWAEAVDGLSRERGEREGDVKTARRAAAVDLALVGWDH